MAPKRIDFPAKIEELRVKFKVSKTNMLKFLESCGELESVDEYCVKIVSEYEHDNICDDPVVHNSNPIFVGFHPITGSKVYR